MRRPSPAIVGSILLHAGVVALAFVSWPEKTEEPKPLVNSVPVSIVSEETIAAAPADNPQPEPSPDDAATAPVSAPEEPAPPVPEPTPPRPTPTPPPPRPTPTPRPTPPRPQPTPPRPAPPTPPKTQPTPPRPTPPVTPRPAPKRDEPSLDLDALAGSTRNTNQRGQRATGQQGAGTASRATGPQLAALGAQVTPNWILNCDMPGMDALVIRVTVRLSSDGQVIGTPRVEQPRNDATGRAASDSMLRAIRATSPFNVPAGFTAQEVPFRFETARQCANR